MKLSTRHRLQRRDFVKWIGGAALALPCLELFELPAKAQPAKMSKYAVFIYTNDGMNPPALYGDPTMTKGTLSPLLPYKDQVLVLGPPMVNNYPVANSGLAYKAMPAQHRANICLTGSQVQQKLNADQFHAVNMGDGPSIDWYIANKLNTQLLLMAMHPIGGDTPSDITYDMGGYPQTRLADADKIVKAIFPGFMAGQTNPANNAAALKEQNAISNFLNSHFKSIEGQLSSNDKITMEKHLAALTEYEASYTMALSSANTAGCAPPSAAYAAVPDASYDPISGGTGAVPPSFQDGTDVQYLSPFIMQSIAIAFSCNISRVATVSFGYPGGGSAGGLRMPWLSVPGAANFPEPLHQVSHNGGLPGSSGSTSGSGLAVAKYAAMNQWIVSQMAYLMGQLKAIKTPTGTLLDETTIYLFNRHGDGNGHTNFALPAIIGGGTGGYFKMGQFLQIPAPGVSPTKVLISIANAMGVPLTTFGTGAFQDTGGMTGIEA